MPCAWIQSGNAAGAGLAASVNRPAPGAGLRHYILGYSVSYNKTGSYALATVSFVDGDTGTLTAKGNFLVSGVGPGPIMLAEPIDLGENTGFQIDTPSLTVGDTTGIAYIMIYGYTARTPR